MRKQKQKRAIDTAIQALLQKNGFAHPADIALQSNSTIKEVGQYVYRAGYLRERRNNIYVVIETCIPTNN